jgi:hypothetical protein
MLRCAQHDNSLRFLQSIKSIFCVNFTVISTEAPIYRDEVETRFVPCFGKSNKSDSSARLRLARNDKTYPTKEAEIVTKLNVFSNHKLCR